MIRPWRITLEVLGPPLLGSLSIFVAVPDDLLTTGRELLPIALVVAYVYGIIPSLAYAITMEIAFARGLTPRKWKAVALSTGLGGLAGVTIFMGPILIALVRTPNNPPNYFTLTSASVWLGIGLAVGLIMGLILRFTAQRLPLPITTAA